MKNKDTASRLLNGLHFLIATPGPEGFAPALAEVDTVQCKTITPVLVKWLQCSPVSPSLCKRRKKMLSGTHLMAGKGTPCQAALAELRQPGESHS